MRFEIKSSCRLNVDFLFKRECLIILVLSTFTTRRVGKTDNLISCQCVIYTYYVSY